MVALGSKAAALGKGGGGAFKIAGLAGLLGSGAAVATTSTTDSGEDDKSLTADQQKLPNSALAQQQQPDHRSLSPSRR
jgi:hypothetical protein